MGNLSKEDKLAKQLMLPRMNKNSKKIKILKKKQGGPVFQKYNVKDGVTNLETKHEEKQKLKPVKPVTPKGMLQSKHKSRRDSGMKGMFYSRKDLINKNKRDYEKSKGNHEEESKEEMMYRILKNKKKEKERKDKEEDEEEDYELSDEEETSDLNKYQNKYQKQKNTYDEMPMQKEFKNVKPMIKKSNSMLPSGNMFPHKESPMKEYGHDSNLMVSNMEYDQSNTPIRLFNKSSRPARSTVHGDNKPNNRSSQKNSETKKSTSMRPKKKPFDPFEDYTNRTKKYDKEILREMLELEEMFTQDFSKHIDSMVALVKKDIAIQADIQEEKGPMKFEESISRVKKILKSKKESLEMMIKNVRRFEDRFMRLKQKKSEQMSSKNMIQYTRPKTSKEGGDMRQFGNMQGGVINSRSMYGLGINPSLKPLNMYSKQSNHQYKGFGKNRNDWKKELDDKSNMKSMMKEMKPNNMRHQFNQGLGSKKELRPIGNDQQQKFSMLPSNKVVKQKLDENGEKMKNWNMRMRVESDVSKDLMKDLDNDLSLI